MLSIKRITTLLLVVALAATTAVAQVRDREKVDLKYKWNLGDVYASDDAWRAAKEAFVPKIAELEKYRGTLAQSPQQLLGALDTMFNLNRELIRLYAYASMASDVDTRVSTYQAMKQEISQIGTQFGAAAAFVQPEILKMDKAKVDSFVKSEPKLKVYQHFLDDILRRQAHTLSEGEEKIIADAGLISDQGGEIYSIFSNADFPFPTVKLSDGKEVKIDKSAFTLYRAVPNRDDRKKVFSTFFDSLGGYRNTFGATMNAAIQRNMFYARARKYPTTIEAALDANNIPTGVYTSLVDGVNANLPSFHRYLNLRKRMLGVDQLHYYDLYAPLVGDVELQYPIEEAKKHILASMAPLGADYVNVVKEAFDKRWIDMYPNEGKRSGAYSQGSVYDVHPYMLMNYNDQYEDMSTMTHELGHTMQSYFSNKAQPFATADYPIFVAEVASTFNEALLNDYMLKQIKDDKVRLSVLGNYLENLRQTVFRQTQFAEFELRMNEMAQRGEAITGEALDKLYMDIVKKYYGHDKGVTVVDDEIAHEWAYIPHFYYNYYVFQYATSYTASVALSEKVLAGDKAATKKYRDFLAAGGSKYPIQLLKDAGVDMTTAQPLELTMKKMNRVIDEIEAILKKQKK